MKIFNLKDWLSNLWIVNLVSQIQDLKVLYKTTKEHAEYLSTYNIRLDWIGRPYTVVNVPEDMAQKKEDTKSYVILQLRKYDAILIKLGITELIFPEITRIEQPGTLAFLFSFKTRTDSFKIWRILWYIFKYATLIFIIIKLITIINKNTDFFINIFDFIKNII